MCPLAQMATAGSAIGRLGETGDEACAPASVRRDGAGCALVWVCERCFQKFSTESIDRLHALSGRLGCELVRRKKAQGFASWAAGHAAVKRFVLVADWREAKPCLQILEALGEAFRPSRMVVVYGHGPDIGRARAWASKVSRAVPADVVTTEGELEELLLAQDKSAAPIQEGLEEWASGDDDCSTAASEETLTQQPAPQQRDSEQGPMRAAQRRLPHRNDQLKPRPMRQATRQLAVSVLDQRILPQAAQQSNELNTSLEPVLDERQRTLPTPDEKQYTMPQVVPDTIAASSCPWAVAPHTIAASSCSWAVPTGQALPLSAPPPYLPALAAPQLALAALKPARALDMIFKFGAALCTEELDALLRAAAPAAYED